MRVVLNISAYYIHRFPETSVMKLDQLISACLNYNLTRGTQREKKRRRKRERTKDGKKMIENDNHSLAMFREVY